LIVRVFIVAEFTCHVFLVDCQVEVAVAGKVELYALRFSGLLAFQHLINGNLDYVSRFGHREDQPRPGELYGCLEYIGHVNKEDSL